MLESMRERKKAGWRKERLEGEVGGIDVWIEVGEGGNEERSEGQLVAGGEEGRKEGGLDVYMDRGKEGGRCG